MQELPVAQTIQEISRKIRPGKAVVYTTQEFIGIVKQKGREPAGGMRSTPALSGLP